MPKIKHKFILVCVIGMAALLLSACKPEEDASLVDKKESIDIDSKTSELDNNKTSEDVKLSKSEDDSGIIELKNNISFNGISFAPQDHFFKDTVNIEIVSDRPCDIYYTLDGSDPDTSKELYQGKIELKSERNTKVYSVKAKGYYKDGTETDTIVHTYFVGKDVDNRFDTLVFNITSDPYNLYDYEYGILIEGKLRDDFLGGNRFKFVQPPDPANFNMRGRESERDIYLEVFEPDGTEVISQKAGVRVYGGWSRANLQKSLKLYARKEYDEVNNKFRYEFFPEKRAEDGTVIGSFKRLVLRNSGNDNAHGFIRDELFQTLAGQAGFKDYHAVRPVTLFINGEYRGFLWLHEVFEDEYFEEYYGEYTGHFEVLEGGETFKKTDEDGENQYAVNDYEEAYAYTYGDLTDDATYNKLRELIDVENYLDYYAYQIHLLNEDWPHNNYKVYRYYAAEGEEYGEAPFDGKWRYLLHDIDYTFGIYGASALTDNLKKYIGNNGKISKDSPLLSQLLLRDDCREYFIKRALDFINGALASDNINKVLDEMNESRLKELLRMYGKNLFADWAQPNQIPGRMQDIKDWGLSRISYMLGKYRQVYNLGELYDLKVKPAAGSGVKINNIEAYSEFNGRYYPDYETVITAIIPAGKELSHWTVNGKTVKEEKLVIDASSVIDKKVEVVSVLKNKEGEQGLIISEICSDGDKDYIILYNPGKEDISLVGYSITDDNSKPGKLMLPARILEGGKSIKILGESNQESTSKGMLRAGFNLKDGETVSLYYKGELLDRVKIPDLMDGSKYVRDLLTMKFKEVRK